jgi:RNA polymerase sigma-70 factor (ECF subfamily)
MSGSAPIAEEVAQEVFMALIRQSGQFDPARARLSSWLWGITRHQVFRSLREHRIACMVPIDNAEPVPTLESLPDSSEGPLEELSQRQRLKELRTAILQLPPRYREVVVMCELDGMGYAAAAEAIGCAVGTVRSRLHRARLLLSRKLQHANAASAAGERAAQLR